MTAIGRRIVSPAGAATPLGAAADQPRARRREWLDEARFNAAIAELRSMPAGAKLLEANRLSTELLLGGVTVAGSRGLGWRSGSDDQLHRLGRLVGERLLGGVAVPGGDAGAGEGHPAGRDVVRERHPAGGDRGEAAGQGERDHRCDRSAPPLRQPAWRQVAEGSEQLFWTNQFTVATTGERAEAGTFSAQAGALPGVEGPVPDDGRRAGGVARQAGRAGDAAGDAHGRDAGAGAAARHRSALHVVHGARLGHTVKLVVPLPAVPRRAEGDATGC